MKLAKVSEDKLFGSFDYWQVDREYSMPIAMYLVHGFDPGGFFYHVLANDFIGAMSRSHPMNDVEALKRLVNWMVNCMPRQAYGGHNKVGKWIDMRSQDRRVILEQYNLILTSEQEMWETLTA